MAKLNDFQDFYDRDLCTVANDAESLHDWQHQQARELAEDDEPLDLPQTPLHAETLTAFVQLLFPNDTITASSLKVALKRLVVVAGMLQPEIGRQSFSALAATMTEAGIDCSRASLSDCHCRLSMASGIVSSDKGVGARSAYSQRAKHIWRKRKETLV